MKEIFAKFTCDECKKESQVRADSNNCTPFPYTEKWAYLYTFQFKIPQMEPIGGAISKTGREIQVGDKHFCSKLCFLKFIEKKMEEYDG
jgi:hypothetical protein